MNDFEVATKLIHELFANENRTAPFCGFYFVGVYDNGQAGTDLSFCSVEGTSNLLTDRVLYEGISRVLASKEQGRLQ